MKKNYVKPAMQATAIEATCIICGSPVRTVNSGGAGIGYGGSSAAIGQNPTARSKDRGLWGDEEDWEEDW